MIIIWTGWGWLGLGITFGACLFMEVITEAVSGNDEYYQENAWPLSIALLMGAVGCRYLARWLRRRERRKLLDPVVAGESMSVSGSLHSFLLIPLELWPYILTAGAIASIFIPR